MRNLTAQELAALEIIRRGDEAVTGIQGTFNGEDAIFIVQVSAAEGSDELRIYPLAMLLRDEDMPFVGGPHDEYPVGPERAAWPDQTEASKPDAWPRRSRCRDAASTSSSSTSTRPTELSTRRCSAWPTGSSFR